jgi:hypothetical protein
VEGLAPSETKEETAHRVTARHLGAPTTLGSLTAVTKRRILQCLHPGMCHDVEKKVNGSTPELTGTL